MKKYVLAGAVAILSMMIFVSCSPSVRVQPTAVVKVRPTPPSPRHVWVDGKWIWRGGRYVWVDGYYAAPRRGGAWVPGYWKTTRRGYVWIDGHWRY